MNSDRVIVLVSVVLLVGSLVATRSINVYDGGQAGLEDVLSVNNTAGAYDIDMNGNQLEQIGPANSGDDAARKDYIQATYLERGGDSMNGTLDMNGNTVKNVADPVDPQDAATKNYVDNQVDGAATIWVDDSDHDGYIENHTDDFVVSSTSPGSGWVKVNWTNAYKYFGSSKTQYDCYDNNSNTYPGQTSYFSTDRGDGSFDYDCDGSEDKRWTDYSTQCDSAAQQDIKWYNSVPACGVEGDLTDEWETCNDGTRIQECR